MFMCPCYKELRNDCINNVCNEENSQSEWWKTSCTNPLHGIYIHNALKTRASILHRMKNSSNLIVYFNCGRNVVSHKQLFSACLVTLYKYLCIRA